MLGSLTWVDSGFGRFANGTGQGQLERQRWCLEDDARVHDPIRIQRALETPHHLQGWTMFLSHVWRARRSDAMLACRRAAHAQRQVVDLIGNAQNALNLICIAPVDQMPRVEPAAADA